MLVHKCYSPVIGAWGLDHLIVMDFSCTFETSWLVGASGAMNKQTINLNVQCILLTLVAGCSGNGWICKWGKFCFEQKKIYFVAVTNHFVRQPILSIKTTIQFEQQNNQVSNAVWKPAVCNGYDIWIYPWLKWLLHFFSCAQWWDSYQWSEWLSGWDLYFLLDWLQKLGHCTYGQAGDLGCLLM